MTTAVNSQATEPTQATEAKDPGELSFPEYEAMRREEGKVAKDAEVEEPSAPSAKAPESKEASESDTEEAEIEEEDADESEDEDSDDESEAKDAEKDKPKKKTGFQRRVAKLNAAKAEAQREAEYWKRKALDGASESKPNATKDDETHAETAGRPDPDSYETYAEYVDAFTDWKLEKREKAKEAEAQKSRLATEQETLLKSFVDRRNAFAKKTEDFEEVLEGVDDVRVSPTIEGLILSSENGPELMYELAKNRAEFERINKLPPLAAARELGKIESKIAATESKKPEPKKLTQAPKPISTLSGGGTRVAKRIDDPNISFEDYERLRTQEMRKRG